LRTITDRPGPFVGRPALRGLVALMMVAASASAGADGPPPVSPESAAFFETSVRPVLVEHCSSCHGDRKQSSGLRVDSRAAMIEGGDEGPAVVPGEPDKSPLVLAVRHQGDHKMPPKGKLPDAAADALARWVQMGAPWPEGTIPSAGAKADASKGHWAYRPARDQAPPAVENSPWVASPVDAFILAKLEANKLAPSPPADRRTLIRRASFDLVGLPPTAAEVGAFLGDDSPGAFAKVVDRLLASPRYGERWGRHWLDVARYADTKGYVFNDEKRYPYSYTYRDYVVRAFNDDLPYDRFVLEQVAADRLDLGDDPRPLAALGFLTVGRRFLNNNDDIIDDRIDVVTRGLLGMSVTCARCHDHKFDPIPTEDYYSLHGVFASSVEPGELPLLPDPIPDEAKADFDRERSARLDKVERLRALDKHKVEAELRNHLAALTEAAFAVDFEGRGPKTDEVARARKLAPERLRFASRRLGKILAKAGEDQGHDPVLAPWRAFAALPAAEFEARAAGLAEAIAAAADPGKPVDPVVLEAFAGDPPKTLAEVAARYGALFERAARAFAPQPEVGPPADFPDPALGPIHDRLVGEESPIVVLPDALSRVLNLAERQKIEALRKKVAELDVSHPGSPARAMVLNDAPVPVNPRVYIRGNPGRPGKEVPRRFLRALSPGGEAKPFADGSGRLGLARAIASPENPLTARVMVNRIWHHHFGVGLVPTPSDFGLRGEAPSHPELLDFLARRFVEGGWSVKAIHRLILLSNAYRQRSDRRDDGFAADPQNRLLWRQNRRRLDFESTRDAVLAVAGRLDPGMGGKPVELFNPKALSTRRTIYGLVDRYDLDPTYRTFDFPSPDISNPQRPSTTVPQQALFLLNSPFLLDQAHHLASRPDIAGLPDLDARIGRLYLDLLGRPAEPQELELGRRFVEGRSKEEGKDGPSPWEEYVQVLLMTNEFAFVD